ncbi:hypothetical protein UPYG_G00017910 [Umbra pygmaea]|uniref:Uncharacterized protein n=1 Tax=Umbra pygmaea TaxID=75934 RepID=A0ABD0XK28_UMBPY
MAEAARPEDQCDEAVEDEFGEIIKCRSALFQAASLSGQLCTAAWSPILNNYCCEINSWFSLFGLGWVNRDGPPATPPGESSK